jgi:hypothetical protein
MAGITTYLSIVTLNVNVLNSAIRRQIVKICYLHEAHLTDKNKYCIRVTVEKDVLSQWTPNKAGLALIISHKVDVKPKLEETKKITPYL